MSLALDIFYFIAWPICLCATVISAFSRKWRFPVLLFGFAVVVGWFFTMRNRESRYEYFSSTWPKSVSELRGFVGSPERKILFPEGDERWTYSVRSYPWARIQWYEVYKDQILSASSRDSVGLFEVEPEYIRDPKESELSRKLIIALDQIK